MVHAARVLRNIAKGMAEISASSMANIKPSTSKPPATALYNPIQNRSWRDLDPMFDRDIPESRKFTIMSYNVLNQAYMWPKVYDEYVDPDVRNPSKRLEMLMKQITHRSLKSDIMCFQEMDRRLYENSTKPVFEEQGYGSIYKQKNKPEYWEDLATANEDIDDMSVDGVALFYNQEKFELVESYEFNISDHYFKIMEGKHTFRGLNLKYDRITEDMQKRNQVAIIAVLKHKASGRIIFATNTHLYWKSPKLQFLQTITLLVALEEFKIKYPHKSTVLLAGDLNSPPLTSVYELLKDREVLLYKYNTMGNYIDKNHPKYKIKNPIRATSNLYDRLDRIQKFKKTTHRVNELKTCFTKDHFDTLDYIWYSDRQLKITRILTGLKESYVKTIEGLPNKDHPSDHIPIRAEFAVIENRKSPKNEP